MTEPHSKDEDKARPTMAGCVLMVLSLAVIVCVALPVVEWRDPNTGFALPRMVAVVLPILAGAAVYGIGTGILKLFGIPVLKHDGNEEKRRE
jgi:hypothetical protein